MDPRQNKLTDLPKRTLKVNDIFFGIHMHLDYKLSCGQAPYSGIQLTSVGDPDPLVRGTNPDPDPSIIKKISKKPFIPSVVEP